jgi:uncharacterized protein with GYD domain
MATFITLVSFTDQGIRNVKDSPVRFEAFRSMAEGLGVTVKGTEEAAAAVLMKVSSLGNVRSQTLRAFDADEMKRIISKMP